MMRSLRPLIPALIALALAAGCGLEEGTVLVTSVSVNGVRGDQIFAGDMEVEVHVYALLPDGETRFVACAGEGTGMNEVKERNTLTEMDGHFRMAGPDDRPMRVDDFPERFQLVVTEDDAAPCPTPQNALSGEKEPLFTIHSTKDDLVGISDPMTPEDLLRDPTLRFDGVPSLTLETVGLDPEPRSRR